MAAQSEVRVDLTREEAGAAAGLCAAEAPAVASKLQAAIARCSESPLLATALHDDLLADSLRRLYVDPLREGRNAGQPIIDTVRAYIASGCNASATAATLGVSRRTVATRLEVAEDAWGHKLPDRLGEIQTALIVDAEAVA